jgi:protein-disulfide isomerase
VISSRVVRFRSLTSPVSRRVYTITLSLGVAVAALSLGCRAPAPGAQDRLSIESAMTKGPVAAPVTIVEFSDYQ